MTVLARYRGEEQPYYSFGKDFLLKVKKGFWTGRIKVAHIHGFHDMPYWDSHREYRNENLFENDFQIIKYCD